MAAYAFLRSLFRADASPAAGPRRLLAVVRRASLAVVLAGLACTLPATGTAPAQKIFKVTGEVCSPGVQTFEANQFVTVGFLIGACGGFTGRANGRAVVVMRRSLSGKESVVVVDALAEIEGRSRKLFVLQGGDVVDVPAKGKSPPVPID